MLDRSLIGRTLHTSSIDVDKSMLRLFARAIGTTDPVYTDEAEARAAGHPSLPVPPTYLFCLEHHCSDPLELMRLARLDLRRLLHAEQQFTYHAMAHAGDRLTFEAKIHEIYDKKSGALEFIVTRTRITNDKGVHVADLRTSLVQRNALEARA